MDRSDLSQLWDRRYVENNQDEIYDVIEHVQRLNPLKTIIEIGVKHCGTLRIWEQLVPIGEGLVIAIDPTPVEDLISRSGLAPHTLPGQSCVESELCEEEDLYDPKSAGRQVHMLTGKAEDKRIRDEVESILNGRLVDYIFHDGDHFHPAPLNDYNNLGHLLRPGGLICVADVGDIQHNSGGFDGAKYLFNHLSGGRKIPRMTHHHMGMALWWKQEAV